MLSVKLIVGNISAVNTGKLLKKFRIIKLFLIEVKARSAFSHDLKGLMKGKGKIQRNIQYVKSLGFKPLLIVVEFLTITGK